MSFALRYDRDDRELTIMAPQAICPCSRSRAVGKGDVREAAFDAWQPKATIRWKPNDAVASTASYAQGFRSGGFNLSGVAAGVAALRSAGVPGMPEGVQDSWDQEDTRGVEFGFKSSLPAARRRSARPASTRESTTRSRSSSWRRSTRRSSATSTRRGPPASRPTSPGCRVSGLQLDVAVGLLDTQDPEERVAGDRRRRHHRQAAAVQPGFDRSTPASAIPTRSARDGRASRGSTTSASVARRSIPRTSRSAIRSTAEPERRRDGPRRLGDLALGPGT